jgi:predicted DNA-binding protein
MAKRKGRPKMRATAESETKPVRLDLSKEVHHMLRVVAAKQGKPMAVFAREAIEELVRKLYDQE